MQQGDTESWEYTLHIVLAYQTQNNMVEGQDLIYLGIIFWQIHMGKKDCHISSKMSSSFYWDIVHRGKKR